MDFNAAMNYFYYRTSLNELRAMNVKDHTFGISYHSLLCLNVIAYIENCTVSKLAEIMQITKSAVTIKVNELVKRGYVEKMQSDEDRRVYHLRLSPTMSAMYGMFDRIGENTEAMLKKKYTEGEVALFTEMLHTIADYDWSANN